MTDDERFMQRALDLAATARGLTSPNPMVGALVVRDGAVIAEACHRRAGEPHAEIEALAAAGARARGATLYVTLEPCTHQGRTPPCAPAVIASGVRRVVIATDDPNPVAGGGAAAVRAAGIDVTGGVLESAAAVLNRIFLTAMRAGRPHVTLKAAATLDGKIADVRGGSQWITGSAARVEAHRLRSEMDAIVVGVGTVLADDPTLTVRLDGPWPREPRRVVLDSTARTPVGARLIGAGHADHAVIAVGAEAPRARVEALRAIGAQVLPCAGADGRVSPSQLLRALFAMEVRGVLVEGGAEVAASFVEAGLVDRVVMFLAPKLLGGVKAPSVIGGGGRALGDAVTLGPLTVRQLGDDVMIEADVRRD